MPAAAAVYGGSGAALNVRRHLAAFGLEPAGPVCPGIIYFDLAAVACATARSGLRAELAASGATALLGLNLDASKADEAAVFEALRLADIVQVNEDGLRQLFAWYAHIVPDAPGPDTDVAMAALMANFSLQGLLVTRGAQGALYAGADGRRAEVSTQAQPAGPAIDAEGAGDGFAAVFMLGRARGWPLELILARAQAFAGALPQDQDCYAPWLAQWQA
jgi:fructokinase